MILGWNLLRLDYSDFLIWGDEEIFVKFWQKVYTYGLHPLWRELKFTVTPSTA